MAVCVQTTSNTSTGTFKIPFYQNSSIIVLESGNRGSTLYISHLPSLCLSFHFHLQPGRLCLCGCGSNKRLLNCCFFIFSVSCDLSSVRSRCVGAGKPSRRPVCPWLLLHRRLLCQILGGSRVKGHAHQVQESGARPEEPVTVCGAFWVCIDPIKLALLPLLVVLDEYIVFLITLSQY